MNKRKFKRQTDNSKDSFQETNNLDVVFFGFIDEFNYDDLKNATNSDKRTPCMVRQVTEEVLKEINELNIEGFKTGQWLISTSACDKVKIHGPFETMEEAFKHGHNHLGVKRYSDATLHML